jgi:hypothetical protein
MADSDLYLRHFTKQEFLVQPQEAQSILKFFFGDNLPSVEQLTDEDVGFAQALLLEAIDKSYAMNYVEEIFDSFYGKMPQSYSVIKGMIKRFVEAAAKNWWDHATGKDLTDPKIYVSVRAMISANFRSTWTIRMITGELTY